MRRYGLILGQNQGSTSVTTKRLRLDVLGDLRWKGWNTVTVPYGKSTLSINGHVYEVYRMCPGEKIAVASKGLNTVATIHELDQEGKLVYAKITGANFFQMKEGQTDPLNTTYGDISAPLCGVYQSLPNQDSTLYYDLSTGESGDCTFHEVKCTHDVYSPVLVYPNANGNYEYAHMVGKEHVNQKSMYTFSVRFSDGYAIGIAVEELSPREIMDDFGHTGMIDIAIGDGGGSAQAEFWNGTEMKYVRDTGRAVASALAIYREPMVLEELVQEKDTEVPEDPAGEISINELPEAKENEEDMREDMTPDTVQEQKTILGQVANLIDVKSIMTIILVCTLCYLVINSKELDDKFMTIVTAVVTFYFSYQKKK